MNLSSSRRGKYFFCICYCICIAKCVLSSFVEHFHFQLQFSLGRCQLTDPLSVCEPFLCLCSLLLLSFRHYQTKAYFKTFWKRYISLVPFTPLCFVFCLHCLVFQSASDSRFALCSSPCSHVLHLHNFVSIWTGFRECQKNRDFTLRNSSTVSSTNDSLCARKELLPSVCSWTSDCCYVLSFVWLIDTRVPPTLFPQQLMLGE